MVRRREGQRINRSLFKFAASRERKWVSPGAVPGYQTHAASAEGVADAAVGGRFRLVPLMLPSQSAVAGAQPGGDFLARVNAFRSESTM